MQSEPDPFTEAIRRAAYGDLNHLLELYRSCEGLETSLHLMAGNNLRNIVQSAANALAEFAVHAADGVFNEAVHHSADQRALMPLRPSMSLFSPHPRPITWRYCAA